MGSVKEDKQVDPLAYVDNPAVRKAIKEGKLNIAAVSGVGNEPMQEMFADLECASNEKLIRATQNCFITLGNDRNAGVSSGYGGLGHSGCSAIDIVAGFMGPRPVHKDILNKKARNNPKDFKNDASRIYLSHKANIDEYFDIPVMGIRIGNQTVPLEQSKGTAGIGIKSDHVRVIARETIKLVTFHGTTNSLGRSTTPSGIDIIAGVNVAAIAGNPFLEVQPMVRGGNLVACLASMIQRIENVQSELSTFIETQRRINKIMMGHTHMSTKPGSPTFPIIGPNGTMEDIKILIDTITDIISNITGLVGFDATYFNPSSEKYILSKFNKNN